MNRLICKLRPHGQAVKTLPSHGRICGSIPHGATIKKRDTMCLFFLWSFPKERTRRVSAVVRQFAARQILAEAHAVGGKRQLPHFYRTARREEQAPPYDGDT